jgi:excisionase family DNA binding protein
MKTEADPTAQTVPPGAWLTVSQAAARLGISERTARRRCESGEIAARLETTESGKKWLINDAVLEPEADSSGQAAARGAAKTLGGAATGAATNQAWNKEVRPFLAAPPDRCGQAAARGAATQKSSEIDDEVSVEEVGKSRHFESAKTESEANGEAAALRATLAERDTLIGALHTERDTALKERDREREEVEFLRARVAELNAVVMQTARALPEGKSGAQSPERPAIESRPMAAPMAASAPPKPQGRRQPRPLWKVLLGIRRD